jgi:hypothetical protein
MADAGAPQPAAVTAAKSTAEQAAASAAELPPAVTLSCGSSLQTDLAIAFGEDARLHSLLASSRTSSTSSPKNSATLELAELPAAAEDVQCLVPAELDSSSAAVGVSQAMHNVADLQGGGQQDSDKAAQQQMEALLSEVDVRLNCMVLQDSSAAAADLAAAVLLNDESSTASLAAFEREVAAMLSQSGAAGSGSSARALQSLQSEQRQEAWQEDAAMQPTSSQALQGETVSR